VGLFCFNAKTLKCYLLNSSSYTKKAIGKKVFKKMLADKKLIQSYTKGKVDLKTIEKAGIKFVYSM